MTRRPHGRRARRTGCSRGLVCVLVRTVGVPSEHCAEWLASAGALEMLPGLVDVVCAQECTLGPFEAAKIVEASLAVLGTLPATDLQRSMATVARPLLQYLQQSLLLAKNCSGGAGVDPSVHAALYRAILMCEALFSGTADLKTLRQREGHQEGSTSAEHPLLCVFLSAWPMLKEGLFLFDAHSDLIARAARTILAAVRTVQTAMAPLLTDMCTTLVASFRQCRHAALLSPAAQLICLFGPSCEAQPVAQALTEMMVQLMSLAAMLDDPDVIHNALMLGVNAVRYAAPLLVAAAGPIAGEPLHSFCLRYAAAAVRRRCRRWALIRGKAMPCPPCGSRKAARSAPGPPLLCSIRPVCRRIRRRATVWPTTVHRSCSSASRCAPVRASRCARR